MSTSVSALARRPRQRGAGTLAIVGLLLAATTLALFYLNRGIVLEQRLASNQLRSTVALETAEAGIEWATGMLNAPWDVGANCNFLDTANESFRKKYVMTDWDDAAAPSSDMVPSAAQPSCRMTDAGRVCSCPADNSTEVPTIAGRGASFSVSFEAVPGDAEAVRVRSWGCAPTDGGQACHAANVAGADANALIEVILKLKPVLRAAPAAPLTCGTSCTVGGSYNIDNQDGATNGALINAGTSISTSPGTSLATVPGQPTGNALIGNDQSLADLSSADADCSDSAMFKAYFGTTIEAYQRAPTTKTLSCGSAADCNSKITGAYGEGWRSFYFTSDLQLSGNSTLGSAADPVTIVTPNALNINGNWTVYGLIFSNSAEFNDLGTGSATIEGAQISCAAYKNNGNGTLAYNPDALKNARRFSALMVRVPGSWKDFD
jgi:Tfp pilus assembly protein PilX